MWRVCAVSVAVAVLVGCATAQPQRPATQLYFAVELKRDGVVVGSPQLLGFAGKDITVERRQPGAALPDYRLALSPRGTADGYRLGVTLEAAGARARGELGVAHGEERSLKLDQQLELKVLLLEVDSPEFQAWVHAAPASPGLI